MKTSANSLCEEEMLGAWKRRDPGFDGLFYFGVRTTGVYCRPSCPSRPKAEHLLFFQTVEEAESGGYRACKRCRPDLAGGEAPEWVAALMKRAEVGEGRISAADLRGMGITPERARRWFQANFGMSFAQWQRGLRLGRAHGDLRAGKELDEAALGNGYESLSGFRSAFGKEFGAAPGKLPEDCVRVALLETPLGPMLAGVDGRAVRFLEFADRRSLERTHAEMRRRFGMAIVPGENVVMAQLRRELGEYFAGRRRDFEVGLVIHGTAFQERVWRELARIPHGRTASYEEVARAIGAPNAVRAVARANATNRIYILVPCHRVIAKSGAVSGYGGGVARKRALLRLERGGEEADGR